MPVSVTGAGRRKRPRRSHLRRPRHHLRLAPDRVIGIHINGSIGYFDGDMDEATAAALTPLEQDRIARAAEFMEKEFGYIVIQSTRPSLIGAMTADSPVTQFAWIYDKLQAWTMPRDTPAIDVLGDFVFDNASLYWLTATAGSAATVVYAQTARWGAEKRNSGVPTAVIVFAHDIGLRFTEEKDHTIVRRTDIEGRGGHIAALTDAPIGASDLLEFFSRSIPEAERRTCPTSHRSTAPPSATTG